MKLGNVKKSSAALMAIPLATSMLLAGCGGGHQARRVALEHRELISDDNHGADDNFRFPHVHREPDD